MNGAMLGYSDIAFFDANERVPDSSEEINVFMSLVGIFSLLLFRTISINRLYQQRNSI